MYIDIKTSTPTALKNAIIKNTEDGEFRTWEIVKDDKDEKLLNHTSSQYTNKVLIRLTAYTTFLRAEPNWWTHIGEPDDPTKAVIIGNFSALLLTYYGNDYTHFETYS